MGKLKSFTKSQLQYSLDDLKFDIERKVTSFCKNFRMVYVRNERFLEEEIELKASIEAKKIESL